VLSNPYATNPATNGFDENITLTISLNWQIGGQVVTKQLKWYELMLTRMMVITRPTKKTAMMPHGGMYTNHI
jgi:hypothetical protein